MADAHHHDEATRKAKLPSGVMGSENPEVAARRRGAGIDHQDKEEREEMCRLQGMAYCGDA